MPKSERQKMKLLAIKDILYAKTDEDHSITTAQLIEELEKMDIKAERKSIYQDIQTLEEMGVDVVKQTKHPKGYYLASREFELPEVKMLVDIVQSARFLTPKKSREMVRKLEGLVSNHQARLLQRNLLVSTRPKTGNETIYYNVDAIHHAINEDRKISFRYCEWNVKKELVPKRDGKRYLVNPCALIWDSENYYLMAYEDKDGVMKNYRVDKMIQIAMEDEHREGKELLRDFNPSEYSKKVIAMFSGEEEVVTLRVNISYIGVILDRFGTELSVRPVSETEADVRLTVEVSNLFYGWLTAMGEGIEVLSPQTVRDEYRNYLQNIVKNYDN